MAATSIRYGTAQHMFSLAIIAQSTMHLPPHTKSAKCSFRDAYRWYIIRVCAEATDRYPPQSSNYGKAVVLVAPVEGECVYLRSRATTTAVKQSCYFRHFVIGSLPLILTVFDFKFASSHARYLSS